MPRLPRFTAAFRRAQRAALCILCTALFPSVARSQSAPPGTDIHVAPLSVRDGRVALGAPSQITRRAGYDNQPAFTPDGRAILFTAIHEDAQADAYRYDLADRRVARLTHTPESEYSPTVTPDGGGFSVVRVEADSTQRLWRFALDGTQPRLVLEHVRPVGYHAWADAHTLALFVLGSPATLQIADVRSGRAEVVARDIGRSLHRIPGRAAVSFVQQGGEDGTWISELDLATRQVRRLARVPEGSEYHAWTPGGILLAAQGARILQWNPARGPEWEEVAVFGERERQKVSRLAVSPRGDWLAFVAEEPRAP